MRKIIKILALVALIFAINILLWALLPAKTVGYVYAEEPKVLSLRDFSVEDYAKIKSAINWGADGWVYFDKIITKESNWNPTAQNPTSTAYGLAQFLNSTWATVDCEKTSDPYTQIDCAIEYINGRYGTSERAWEFHTVNNYY